MLQYVLEGDIDIGGAIAAGVGDGLGFGDNSKAALVTRAIVEMRRLGMACGAQPETFTGLSGLGSNVATFLGTPSSANLAAALTDETGSGAAMFGTSPTVTTSLIMADAANLVLNTGTGTKIGTATGQKLSFWNQTPTAQPSGAGQAAITDSTGGVAASSLVDVTTAAVADPAKVNANFATINVLLLALRTAALNTGLIKGSA